MLKEKTERNRGRRPPSLIRELNDNFETTFWELVRKTVFSMREKTRVTYEVT